MSQKSGMYAAFQNDSSLEQDGIWYHFLGNGADFKVKVARAGGGNIAYAKTLDQKTKHLKRAIEAQALGPDLQMEVMKDVYASCMIKGWKVRQGNTETGEPKYVDGIESPTGELLPATRENILKVFKDLPDVFQEVLETSRAAYLFREVIAEEEEKN